MICNKEFEDKQSTERKTCSRKCLGMYLSKIHKGRKLWKQRIKKTSGENSHNWKGGKPKCIDCGKELGDYKSKRCPSCQGKISRSGENKKCPVCEKIFWVKPSAQERRETCSKRCLNKLWIRTEKFKGENNASWLGGKSFEPYGIEFNEALKEKIRKKFNRMCFECGYSEKDLGYKLSIHHVDYNKQNNSDGNLIPLCRSCHTQTNFERIDWTEYFQSKVKSWR